MDIVMVTKFNNIGIIIFMCIKGIIPYIVKLYLSYINIINN